ncbi:MAG: YgiQ family radical SAM protein [Clostridia bacterium]|nr:YgiQ family radical SAM protein [Clostridia bacterium]
MNNFLPICKEDLEKLNISQLDFVYVVGDAYVDHPSFGCAIISRVLESAGYTVGIIAQPDWRDTVDFKKLGKPRLAFLVSAGNIDSMVNHYTVAKKIRTDDSYSPGGKAGYRPDRATIVYCNRIREAYGDVPIVIGGVEASLRRFAHYDYWDNKVRRSILFDSRSNLLLYGMGEHQIVEVADKLNSGLKINEITDVLGSAYISKKIPEGATVIPDFESVRENKKEYAVACKMQYEQSTVLVQKHIDKYLVVNMPSPPLTESELDKVYSLPYTRNYHPIYEKDGGIPAIKEVKFSITSSRGCFGACNFCAIAFHQGRKVTSRSHKSILKEAEMLTYDEDFKGYINDVGGPTANFRNGPCSKDTPCTNRQCLYPNPCKNLKIDHSDYLSLMRKLRSISGIKKVFIRSGIRYDYLIHDKNDEFFKELCMHHVSGQLKVAPEHVSDNVLSLMGKPSKDVYNRFVDKYKRINEKLGKKQYIVPYLMSSHPGSTINDAIILAEYLRDNNINPQQVQDFYPTPGTISTCMYYTGINPRNMEKVYVPTDYNEKQMQRALLQYKNPANYNLVYKALVLAGREDLIGYGKKCLIRPKGENRNGKDFRRESSIPKNKERIKGRSSKSKGKRR